MKACLRCGYCCSKATCRVGALKGASLSGRCSFLRGTIPGRHSCRLAEVDKDLAREIGVGAGCCSPNNGWRAHIEQCRGTNGETK